MGMMVDGEWVDDDTKLTSKTGAFVRAESVFRHRLTADGSSGFEAEPGRYHLFAAHSCPWAHRAVLYRKLKGLENVVSMTLADLPRQRSWAYSEGIGKGLDPVDGVFELHRAYAAADPRYTGRVTVPTLWDKKEWTIVNNESSEIIRMFDSEFRAHDNGAPEFYPRELRAEIDALNERIYATVNNGVYRCGFAKSQEAYEEAFAKLFETLDFLEDRLSRQRYLAGDRVTEADWRAFPTLLRFDPVYYGHFKCNLRRLIDYPNLWNYLLDLYQYPGVSETVNLQRIKAGYYGSMKSLNPYGIVPVGPEIDLDAPHDRDRFAKAA